MILGYFGDSCRIIGYVEDICVNIDYFGDSRVMVRVDVALLIIFFPD